MDKKLRDVLLGGDNSFRSKTIVLPGKGKSEVEIRQLSYKKQKEIREKSVVDGLLEFIDYSIWGVIYSTYYPGTDDRLFEDSDFNQLIEMPPQKWFEHLRAEVQEYLYFSTEEEEAVKKKPETESEA